MRKRNWRQYNKELVQRGSLTFLIDPEVLSHRPPKDPKKNGRPKEFTDQLIIMLMLVKIHFKLTYRALEGFMEYLLRIQGCESPIPSYSLVCKRARHLKAALPQLSSSRPSIIALDASGLKVYGEGEWKVKIHGRQKPRKWIKVHIALDLKTQEIVAESTTASNIKDGQMTGCLLQALGPLKEVLADGSYDDSRSREEIRKKGARALIPPPRNAILRGRDKDRDSALRIITGFGSGKEAKSLWGKLTGYSLRVLVETAFSRMKRFFGERLFSKITANQEVENYLRCVILNKLKRIAI